MNGPDPPWTWRHLAACRGIDPGLFYPENHPSITVLRAICDPCPVRSRCLEWALAHEKHGYWGGKTENARKTIRRGRGLSPEAPPPAPAFALNGSARHNARALELRPFERLG